MNVPLIISPGLVAASGAAYELKMTLPRPLAEQVEGWARERLVPDPHGEAGQYRTTSVYCDTPRLDVYHRTPGYRRSKYRLRRYGDSPVIYLERKTRRGDRLWKRRCAVEPAELAQLERHDADAAAGAATWAGDWFHRKVRVLGLVPTCRVVYLRTAFLGGTPEMPIRLTLDRELAGAPAGSWHVEPVVDGRPLLAEGVVLELKYRETLPGLFRELLAQLPPDLGRVSKYRLCARAWGLGGGEG